MEGIWMARPSCVLNVMAVCILARFSEILWTTITASRPFLRLPEDCILWLSKILQDLIDWCKATCSPHLCLEKSGFLRVCVLFSLQSSLSGLTRFDKLPHPLWVYVWQNTVIGVIRVHAFQGFCWLYIKEMRPRFGLCHNQLVYVKHSFWEVGTAAGQYKAVSWENAQTAS